MGILDVEDADTIEGESEALEKVHRFIKNIQESLESEGGHVFICSKHGREAEEEDPVFSSELEPGESASDLAREIVQAAIEDASEYYKGRHKYVVRAENVRTRCLFSLKVTPGEEDEDMDDIEEMPNKKGLLSQMMRHQEKIMKVAVGTVGKITDQLMKSNREKDERIKDLENKQFENIKLAEELVSGKHARDIELRKIENREKRMGEIAGMVMQSAPMVLSMIANSNTAGEAPPAQMGSPAPGAQMPGAQMPDSQLEVLVESLLGSLSQEQFQQIMQSGVFSPQQIMALVEIAKTIKAKQDAQEVAAAAANAVANG